MKAILVVDMPNNCEECPCCYGFICSPLAREMGTWAIHNGKPTDCPLEPLPTVEAIPVKFVEEFMKDHDWYEYDLLLKAWRENDNSKTETD